MSNSEYETLVEQLKPETFFANFSALLPSGDKAVHVQFITTKVNAHQPFIVGPEALADSITHAIISYNRDDQGEFVIRQAEGTVYGSIDDPFDIYVGRKKAFERALAELTSTAAEARLTAVFDEFPPGSCTKEARLEILEKAWTAFKRDTKAMRAFMWEKFRQFFPTPESI